MITLIGMGSGTPGSLTAQGLAALQGADRILGAKRLLATLPEGCTGNRQALYKPDEILACLAAHPDEEIALVYSGDTGFYSGASQLLPMLRGRGQEPDLPPDPPQEEQESFAQSAAQAEEDLDQLLQGLRGIETTP